ncbi:sensor histidine kinase [Lentzea sp. NPDC006480]|uniref:sensor histidine kinase n=1 Tax=Lentzea sp. NPDC006480 TaxID=3157176 RepID=UPI00339E88F0
MATVLADVEAAVTSCPAESPLPLTAEIGVNRALHAIHPVESVKAATALFEVALPTVVNELRRTGYGDTELIKASTALHRSIMSRIAQGSVSYASYLLKKVTSSHEDERHRIARELHDRVAHAVGNALQHLELHDAYLANDPARAQAKLKLSQDVLHDAFDVIRHLATELRTSAVLAGGLQVALSDYLDAHAPFGVLHHVTVEGDVLRLPSEVVEELYLVLREAARNALLHAAPQRVGIEISVGGNQVRASVGDDGCGFDLAQLDGSTGGIGLESMRERVELLGGTFIAASSIGEGTTVTVTLPWLDAA